MMVRGRHGRAPSGRAALALAFSLRLGLLAAAEAAAGGSRCATGSEVARLRCQLDEATERLDLAVKLAAHKEALFARALEAKDAELAQKEALLKAKDAEFAHKEALFKLTLEAKDAELVRKEAEREEAVVEGNYGELEHSEDTELDWNEASATGEDTLEVGRQQAPLLPEDPRIVKAQLLLGERSAGADEHVHAIAPRLHGTGSDGPAPPEEARRSEGALTWTAQSSTPGRARAARLLRETGDELLGRLGWNLRDEAPGTVMSRLGAWHARAGDRPGDTELWHLRGRAVDEEDLRRYRGWDSAGQARAQEQRTGAGPGHGGGRPGKRFTGEGRSNGRLLAAADLPSVIAGLPDNTTRISLPRMGLTGTLPADLGRLVDLEYLDVSGNNITGTLPAALFGLAKLQVLQVQKNLLAGSVPAQISSLAAMTWLDLSSTRLTGTLPNTLCGMTKLVKLYLGQCQLEGIVPSCLGSLPSLEGLSLGKNSLTGTVPEQLGNLTKLTYLDLQTNQLSGTIPPELGRLARLTRLYLIQNQLSGTIPPELGKLGQMSELILAANQLSGTIPPDLGKLTQLTWLLLSDNQITGTVPRELGNLVNLQYLWLPRNQLSGTIPPELGNCSQLVSFTFSRNQLTGTLPNFSKLTKLTQLYAFGNQLSGTIPISISQLTGLQYLQLQDNRFSGILSPELGGRMSRLTTLNVSGNLLTGTVPNELAGRLVNLAAIDLSRNNLHGTLPLWIGQLQALQILSVQENPHLTGTFPDTTNCTSLLEIWAQGCAFTSAGAVAGSVQILSFARNALAELPDAWVNLPALKQLDLSDNHISAWMPYGVLPYGTFQDGRFGCGHFPLQIRLSWPAVESVDLSGNPLGQNTDARDFVWSLAYLPQLSKLRAARCQLRGAVPYEGPWFAVNAKDTNCSDSNFVMRDGFPALLVLDLSQNNLSSIMPPPPTRLQAAVLHSNAVLRGLDSKWYSIFGTLEVWGSPLLRADVLPPFREGGCPGAGAPGLEANPLGWVTEPGGDFQCTELCAGTSARYKHDSVLNASSLCRCTAGRQGAAMNCSGCPADTYSQAEDEFAMLRTCRPCPVRSSTDGVENATGADQCKCPAGWYMQAAPAGPANETNGAAAAPACARCKQRQFMETVPGATKEDECACNRSYDGLRAVLGVCGCADGLYMDHMARACTQCDAVAERCTWGSAVDLSLRPPVVEASYWAAPALQMGPDEASNFSRHDIWRCFSRNTCKGDSVCASGRSGTACSLCEAGMYGGPDGPCHPCPGNPEESRKALLYGLLIGPAATLAAHMALQSSADSRGLALIVANLRTSLKQSVKYLQMLGVLSAFRVNWPPLARQFLTDIPRITVALPQLAGVACLAGQQSASLEMGFRWLLPVAGLGSACLSALLLLPVRRCCRNSRWHRRLEMSGWDVLRVCLWGLTLFFSTLLQFGTQVLTCAPSPNGQSTVLTFPHLTCGGAGEWARLAALSSAFLLAFVFAVYLGVYAAWRRTVRALVDSAFQSRGWWGFLFDDYRSGWGHWVLLSMAKDTALVVVATAGASDGPSQVLATTAGAVLYAYAVLRDQPFRDSSNSLLEAWTAMSMAALSVFAAGMGYPGSPNLADIADLYPGGVDNALYKRRERALLVLQWLTLAGPAGIMLCQLLGMCDRVTGVVPSCLRPMSEKERAEWNKDFDAASSDFKGVMERLDAVDSAKLRHLMSTSVATLGLIRSSSAGGITGVVRRRFSDAARGSEPFQEALRSSRGNLPVLNTEAGSWCAQKEKAASEQVLVLVHPEAQDEGGSPVEGDREGDNEARVGMEEVGMHVNMYATYSTIGPLRPEVCSGNAVERSAAREKRVQHL